MKTWNVLTGVVQLIEAETAEEARQIAAQRLEAVSHVFDGNVYDLSDLAESVNDRYQLAFESEPVS